MDMLIGGQWISKDTVREICSPFDGAVVDTVPAADTDDVRAAIDAAEQGAKTMTAMPAHRRSQLLRRTSELLAERQEEIVQLLAREVGKTLRRHRDEKKKDTDHSAGTSCELYGRGCFR